MNPFSNSLVFIVNFIFSAYIYILLLRLFMQKLGASWHNPLSQFVVKATDPLIKPLQRIVPGVGGFDLSVVALAIVLQLIAFWILAFLVFKTLPGMLGSLVVVVAYMASKVINLFFVIVIASAILSWFPNARAHPVANIVDLLAYPLTSLARRIIPLIGGDRFIAHSGDPCS